MFGGRGRQELAIPCPIFDDGQAGDGKEIKAASLPLCEITTGDVNKPRGYRLRPSDSPLNTGIEILQEGRQAEQSLEPRLQSA